MIEVLSFYLNFINKKRQTYTYRLAPLPLLKGLNINLNPRNIKKNTNP